MLHALDDARGETEAALARQRQFVADASHELRTPLTSVLANLELLEMELEGEPREAAASALRSSAGCAGSSPTCCCSPAPTPAASLPTCPWTSPKWSRRPPGSSSRWPATTMISVAAEPGAEVEGARDELHRLTLNLLENALRHTDPGTAVEATVERRNGEVVLSVEDDGPGIPPELRDKVFERFFRGAGDRSGSSGLGLSIVRAVATRTTAPSRWRSRSTAAGRGSWSGFPPALAAAPQAEAGRCRFPGRTAIRRKGAPMSDITSQQLVVFTLGSEEYALPIGAVHEIIRYTEPRSVASESAWVRGVISLRGKIIPVFDLAARLGLAAGDREGGKIVIVETGTDQAGVIVDDVEEVLTVDAGPARRRPGRRHALDRRDRQDRRPPGHPARPRGPLRAHAGRRRARPPPSRATTMPGASTTPPASSSPTTPAHAPHAGRRARPPASTSSARPPTATRRSSCAASTGPTR